MSAKVANSGNFSTAFAYRFDWAKGERETVDGSDGIEAETVGTVDGIGGHKPSERHAETVDGSDAHITQEEHRKRKRESNDSLFTDADDIEIAFKEYNEVAKNLGLSIAGRLTPGRRAKLRTRLKDVRLPGWRKALEQLAHSSIITGGASSGWRCDLDFLLRPDKLQRLIEGGYLSKPQPEKDWRPSDTGFWVKCDSPPGRAWDEFWKKTKNTRHWEYEPGGEIHVDSLWPNRR